MPSPVFTVLIPARLASTRLPNKPLADLEGLPMVVRVAQRALLSRAQRAVVAADDVRIVQACQAHGIEAVLTRNDHPSGSDRLAETCELLGLDGDDIVVNVQGDEPLIDPASIDALRTALQGKISVFVGQSGMGKSSLLNAWIPNAAALTQEYSVRLDTGKHTTTACRYFELPESWGRDETGKLGALIDSPGFQEFGLAHMSVSELQHAFREFKDLLGKCRFHNCAHLSEPDCAVREAVDRNEIAPERLALFRQLHSDSKTADVQIQGISQAKERWSALATKPSKR